METKRLIPYSVHLREDIYLKLKEAAQGRKATALVRDAITMIIEGDDAFNAGYNKAIRDCISVIKEDDAARYVAIQGNSISEVLCGKLSEMLLAQAPMKITRVKDGKKI